MAEVAELQAVDVMSEENRKSQIWLTKAQLERRYRKGHRIVYFLDGNEPHDKIARQQAVLKLAQETGGWIFTGHHSDFDWSETRWWGAGWHLWNRTGEYAVVIKTE